MKIGKLTIVAFAFFVLSFCTILFFDQNQYSILFQVIADVSLPVSFVLFLWDIARYKKSLKLLIIFLYLTLATKIIVSIIGVFRYYSYKVGNDSIWNIRSIFAHLWLLLIIALLVLISRIAIRYQKYSFSEITGSAMFRIISLLIFLAIIISIPVFQTHFDFEGGFHGHPFWVLNHLH